MSDGLRRSLDALGRPEGASARRSRTDAADEDRRSGDSASQDQAEQQAKGAADASVDSAAPGVRLSIPT
jgi:hypothetical protein